MENGLKALELLDNDPLIYTSSTVDINHIYIQMMYELKIELPNKPIHLKSTHSCERQ